MKPTRVGSLCTGYGGIELGLAMAGVEVDLRWTAEVEPALAGRYGQPNLGDIRTVDWRDVEPVDLLVGGIPCQPTSAAGRRLGEDDPRWLWPYTRDALEIMRPDRFLLENVRGLVGHKGGYLFRGILEDLASLGYDVRWLTLGACAVGLAHHRHRVFVLAEQCGWTGASQPVRLDVKECGLPRGAALPTAAARDGDTDKGRGEGDAAYWERRRAQGRTEGMPLGSAVSLLPTPSATPYGNNQGGANPEGPVRHSLDSLASRALLPTPQASDAVMGSSVTRSGDRAGQANGLASVAKLLPTPTANDGVKRSPDAPSWDRHGSGGRNGSAVYPLDVTVAKLPGAVQPERWDRFAGAVARHALTVGTPPPEPTEPNRNGNPRLRAEFVEWLMAVPAGHVTGQLDRAAALKALGNGVVPLQLAVAWDHLTGGPHAD